MTRVQARATLLAIALQDAIDYELHGQRVNEAIHQARELRREIRKVLR
jgi:hypothetical protein